MCFKKLDYMEHLKRVPLFYITHSLQQIAALLFYASWMSDYITTIRLSVTAATIYKNGVDRKRCIFLGNSTNMNLIFYVSPLTLWIPLINHIEALRGFEKLQHLLTDNQKRYRWQDLYEYLSRSRFNFRAEIDIKLKPSISLSSYLFAFKPLFA